MLRRALHLVAGFMHIPPPWHNPYTVPVRRGRMFVLRAIVLPVRVILHYTGLIVKQVPQQRDNLRQAIVQNQPNDIAYCKTDGMDSSYHSW